MALWYLEALKKHISENPTRCLYFDGERTLNGLGLAKLTLALRPILERQSMNSDCILVKADKQMMILPAILAAGLLGLTYVPVADDIPRLRLEAIHKETGQYEILDLSDCEMEKELHANGDILLNPLENLFEWMGQSINYKPDQPLYILFTSGSTGVPKGVMIGPSQVQAFMNWSVEAYNFSTQDVLLAHVPYTFDLSVMDLYACLICGASLVGVPKDIGNDTIAMVELIRNKNVTSIFTTPSLFNLLRLDRNFNSDYMPSLKQFLVCGEVFPKKVAKVLSQAFPEISLYNLYGPTEATVAITSLKITKELLEIDRPLPIGNAMGNGQCVLLDENNELIEGKEGELTFISDTVGIGYLNMPDKTNEVFICLTLNDGRKVRAYKTGDYGYIEDGMIFFSGRKDNQIKWSGYRIELGEIEHAIGGIADVIDVVLTLRKLSNGTVTAVIANILTQAPMTEEDVKNHLIIHLPSYMIPSAYNIQPSFPLTSHGKIDRAALS